jgi:hypothetical protein
LDRKKLDFFGVKKMDWSKFDEEYEPEKTEPVRRRGPKRFDGDEDDIRGRQKKSSKRFHHKKTLKEELWEE